MFRILRALRLVVDMSSFLRILFALNLQALIIELRARSLLTYYSSRADETETNERRWNGGCFSSINAALNGQLLIEAGNYETRTR